MTFVDWTRNMDGYPQTVLVFLFSTATQHGTLAITSRYGRSKATPPKRVLVVDTSTKHWVATSDLFATLADSTLEET